jgi:hypothetical protein
VVPAEHRAVTVQGWQVAPEARPRRPIGFALGLLGAAYLGLTLLAPIAVFLSTAGDCGEVCPGTPPAFSGALWLDAALWVAAGVALLVAARWPRRWLFATQALIGAVLAGQAIAALSDASGLMFLWLLLPGALVAIAGGVAGVRVLGEPGSRLAGDVPAGLFLGLGAGVAGWFAMPGIFEARTGDLGALALPAVVIGFFVALVYRTRSERSAT